MLDGIDLEVQPGESLVVIGGSGTGKSVAIKCILGLIKIDSGSIKVDGREVSNLKGKALADHQARFGMLFQGGALFDSLPIWRNVSFALSGPAASRRAAAIDTLARVGLGADVADLRPAELSGGMQKRVALARAIASKPEILFFDEPTTGLDPIMADVINDLIRNPGHRPEDHRADHHPRHGIGPQDRRFGRHALWRQDHLAGAAIGAGCVGQPLRRPVRARAGRRADPDAIEARLMLLPPPNRTARIRR